MERIICNVKDPEDLEQLFSLPDRTGIAELSKLGFTDLLLPEDASITQIPEMNLMHELDSSVVRLDDHSSLSPESLWLLLEPKFARDTHALEAGADNRSGVMTMLQMSVPITAVVPLSPEMVPGSVAYQSVEARSRRELLRSLNFWRTRFGIGRMHPKLVHAADDGLLIYVIDSWLVVLNLGAEEASVDVGQSGTMWLMLGTDRDVFLHGSLLELPASSGAILANELARQGGRS